jgi:protein MpaA
MEIMETKTRLGNTIKLLGEPKQNSTLIIGVVHGDEPQGKWLIEKYLSNCKSKSQSALFIPCLNPDGLAKNTRTNANGVDINRNFPTKNWGENKGDNATCDDKTTAYYGGKSPASEIETQFVIKVVEKFKPKLILTLHAPYKVVNYDGDAKIYAQKVSEIIKYPIEESIGYPTPGSFGTWAGIERDIPIITLELDENCPIEDLKSPIFKIFDTIN